MSLSQVEHPPPPPKAPILVRLLRLAILGFIGVSFLALALAIALIGWQMSLQERIVPGVSIGEVDIGGLTRAEAAAALESKYAPLETVVFTFHDGEQSWTATAAELGLDLPAEALAERAFSIGHGEDAQRNMREQANAWFAGATVALRLEFNEARARAFLEGLAGEINRERQDAEFHLNGFDVVVSLGLSGRELDIAATLSTLSEIVLAQTGETEIALVIDESPPRQWNVMEAATQVRTALSSPLQLIGSLSNGDLLAPWILTREQILAGLSVTLQGEGDERRFDVSVDLGAYGKYLRTLSPSLSKPSAEGRFDFDPASGQLTPISLATEGRRLDVEETIRRLEAAVFDPVNRRVVMYFETLQPRYPAGITAAELGISQQVAEATTYYWGSWPNRRSNIALGAGKLHGIIVAPGEEFSFNQHLGDISPEAGYLEGSVILGGATVTGIGGGICQVSTTMFRAAFSGGYAITERNSHGYRVGYYEYAGAGPGLDAAIWQPEVDLRFQNNSPYHLLIESSFLGAKDALQFRIYSSPHWRTVIEAPIIRDIVGAPPEKYVEATDLAPGQVRQIDYSADGADVLVYRNVYDSSGNLVKRDQLFTHYSPWQAVFEVAPGDPRLAEEDDEGEEDDGIAPVGVAD
ncbi:MAG: VanW family protein [Chloroflexi bacterium]|nr:VanW family protein [Chloroflexota bacterium]